MRTKLINILLVILYIHSASLILVGIFFSLEKLPHGFTILIIGFTLLTMISFFDRYRLKKEIKKLKELNKTHLISEH